MAAVNLPTRFPCWVKAVYSWGGETKHDLGFIEGDLIECLNAGDGMWWMGRLRRDRRMAGLFPSNFVTVLDDSFQPAPRRSSPMIPLNATRTSSPSTSASNSGQVTPSPQKSRFRKPFKSYSKEVGTGSPTGTPSPPGSLNTRYKPKPFSSMKNIEQPHPLVNVETSRPPSPTIPSPVPRAGSARYQREYGANPRSSSPAPYAAYSRPQSPLVDPQQFDDMASSSPPPAPPAHGVAFNNATSYEPSYDGFEQNNYGEQDSYAEHSNYHEYGNYGEHDDYADPRPSSPRSASPALSGQHSGRTPSPLRDAIKDVMTSLEGMSVAQRDQQDEDDANMPALWSPGAFQEVYSEPAGPPRPYTSLGLDHNQSEPVDGAGYGNLVQPTDPYDPAENEQLNTYVQRMETRLRNSHLHDSTHQYFSQDDFPSSPPAPPPKGTPYQSRPASSMGITRVHASGPQCPESDSSYGSNDAEDTQNIPKQTLQSRQSAYELGRPAINRNFTEKSSVTTASSAAQSNSTNKSQSTQLTSQSVMSGHSAGGFSATSAGSLARRKWGRSGSIKERPQSVAEIQRPSTAMSSHHSSEHSSQLKIDFQSSADYAPVESCGVFGGFVAPAAKKRGFFSKVLDTVKTGTASARSNMGSNQGHRPSSRQKSPMPQGISSTSSNNHGGKDASKDMGLGGNGEWVQMRRDVNRSNSLSRNERTERIERCQMMDIPVLTPVDILNQSAEGDEASDGSCVSNPTDFSACNLALVDKSARFLNNLPAVINAASLAQGYLCRPYRSDVQRLRAIFTWVAERITLEDDFEGDVDTRRVIQTRRGCAQEIATLVTEMCNGAGFHAEVVRGHLKAPGDSLVSQGFDESSAYPNHWWTAVIADGEWRIMDCALASPSNPRRSSYTSAPNQVAEPWWFLARPVEICYTHVPLLPKDQHIVPPMSHDVLMALPVASPGFFKNQLQLWDFDTSLIHLDGLEMAHIQLSVPGDVECTAEVEARAFAKDSDGDYFESGDLSKKRALAQGEYVSTDSAGGMASSFKRYTIKAVLPSSDASNTATLKVFAGKRGLQHSVTLNPHKLALSLPLSHTGPNPLYDFCTRHPTPHALRHELYISGPLCKRLVFNNTFVFAVRQHPSASGRPAGAGKDTVGTPSRPGSALSMASVSASGSNTSDPSVASSGSDSGLNQLQKQADKPAKLAIQSPSGKILRMTRKPERLLHAHSHQSQGASNRARRVGAGTSAGGGIMDLTGADDEGAASVVRLGSLWETIIKIGERGTWRGLVLADRSARWCVFAEWECV